MVVYSLPLGLVTREETIISCEGEIQALGASTVDFNFRVFYFEKFEWSYEKSTLRIADVNICLLSEYLCNYQILFKNEVVNRSITNVFMHVAL